MHTECYSAPSQNLTHIARRCLVPCRIWTDVSDDRTVAHPATHRSKCGKCRGGSVAQPRGRRRNISRGGSSSCAAAVVARRAIGSEKEFRGIPPVASRRGSAVI